MQDEYKRTFENIRMSDDRKSEMRKALENEMASAKKPAKTTRLTSGKKAGIAVAAAGVIALGTVFCIPSTRNTIVAGVRALFAKEVPEDAIDAIEYEQQAREERVIPDEALSDEEILEQIAAQDREIDEYNESVTVTSDYYADDECLYELAVFYEQQGCTLFDLGKGAVIDYVEDYTAKEWYSKGFTINVQVGDNAYGHTEWTCVFKATEDQLQNFLDNQLARINYERRGHNQAEVSFDELWTKDVDGEGNIVYTGSWTGPDPELKLLDSDSARFLTYEITYDPNTQIAVCLIKDGGGVG